MDKQVGQEDGYPGDAPLPSVVTLLAEAVSRHAEQGHWDQAERYSRQLLRVTVQARQLNKRDVRRAGKEADNG